MVVQLKLDDSNRNEYSVSCAVPMPSGKRAVADHHGRNRERMSKMDPRSGSTVRALFPKSAAAHESGI